MTRRIRRALAATGVSATLALTGCSVDPARLALPTGDGPTYSLRILFANALNLPARAKVMVNGAKAGRLERVTVVDPAPGHPGYAVAEVEISRSVTLPAATRAQLRQDTVLGDIYISLDTTAPGDETLPPGGVIPMSHTEPALQIEDLIAGLATFVSGGALHSAQDIVDQLNSALPTDPAETGRIAGVLKDDLIDVAAHLDRVDDYLSAVNANVAVVQDNRAALDELLTAQGAHDITRIAQTLVHVVGVYSAIAEFAHALLWITPLARSGEAAAKAFVPLLLADGRPLDLDAPSNLTALEELLRTKVIPFFEHGPKLAVTGLEIDGATPPDQQVDTMISTLRMIGMVR